MAGTVGTLNFREIHFDTRSRISGTISNPTFTVNQVQRIKQIQVMAAEIPKTWYVFTEINNKIDFVEPISGPAAVATITPGNYTIDGIQSHIETILNAASPNGFTYTVSVDPNISKITITSTGIFSLLWATGANAAESPYYELGFDNTVDNTGSTNYTAPGIYDVSGENYLFIKLEQIPGNDSELTANGGLDTQILARIPILVNSGETIEFLETVGNPTQLLFNDSSTFTQQLTFRLSFRNNVNIDMNGRDWSMMVGIFT